MAHRDEQKQELVRLLGPLIPDNEPEDGYLNWMLQCTSYDDMKKCAEYVANLIRGQVGVQTMVWDDALANDAKYWAQVCASRGGQQHASWEERKHQGENIYQGHEWNAYGFTGAENSNGSSPNGNVFLDAMLSWTIDNKFNGDRLSEKDRFDRRTGGVDGHYTQVVWNSTTKFGMGFALYGPRNPNFGYDVIVVGRFSPSGNMQGQRPY